MSGVSPSIKALLPVRVFKKISNPVEYLGVQKLPAPYQKFYNEWTDEENSTPVHWVPRSEKWQRNPETGEVTPVQNCPIPVKYPNEMHQGIWGGEGVVEGWVKKNKWRRPVPWFWVPKLQEDVVYSEILDKYLKVMVTPRALKLIDHHCGLDYYLLQTPANDLKSFLALKLKARLLLALCDKDFAHTDPQKQEEIYNRYSQYMIPREEAEWYGLTYYEAKAKWEDILKTEHRRTVAPLKHQYRMQLLQKLEYEKNNRVEPDQTQSQKWMSKLNPFNKPEGAPSSSPT